MSSKRVQVPRGDDGIKRSTTKSKVNVVSKASLALLNPAYAMGIENSLEESEDSPWKSNSLDLHSSSSSSSSSSNSTKNNSGYYALMQNSFHNDSTPELAAFTIEENAGSGMENNQEDIDDWEYGFGGSSVTMQRKTSNNSVFEDDEQPVLEKSAGRRPAATTTITTSPATQPIQHSSSSNSSSSNRSLSKLFSRKRSNSKASNGNKTPVTISSPQWGEVPSSAPAHYTTFEAAAAVTAIASPEISSLSSSKQTILRMRNALARKSSMPTLREVRRITAAADAFQKQCQPNQNKSILWSDGYVRPNPPVIAPAIPSHARLVNPRMAAANRPISSVGKGARKSSYDNGMSSSGSTTSIILTPEIQDDFTIPTSGPKKVQKKKTNKRFEAWGAPNVPPLPSLEQMMGPTFSSTMKESMEVPVKTTRRRSKSVDAILSPVLMTELPSLVTPEGLFDTSIEKEDQEEEQRQNAFQEAQRVNLTNRPTVIGTSSPKLVNFSPRLNQTSSPTPSQRSPLSTSSNSPSQKRNSRRRSNRNSSSTILGVPTRLAAPVVVNVMPPTPDLSSDEYATFNGEIPSPGVRRSLEMSDIYFSAAAANTDPTKKTEMETISKNEESQSALDAIAKVHSPFSTANGDVDNSNANHRRTQSTMSDLSDFSISAASESGASTTDEPFGFSRSLSMISMLSRSSHSSGSDSSPSSEEDDSSSSESDEESGSVEQAQIISVSPSNSSFSRAQLVSPRAASLASPRCPNKSNFTETSLAASIQSSSSLGHSSSSCSSVDYRDSQRFGGSLASLSSGQSLASVLTACTSVIDHSRQGSVSSKNGKGDLKKSAVHKRLSNGKSDLREPVEIQSMLDSFGVSTVNVQDEDDCDTPRLSDGNGFGQQSPAPSSILASGFQSTKPLNVRKTVANSNTVSPPPQTNDQSHSTPAKASTIGNKNSPAMYQVSPPHVLQTLTPGLSPTPMRPYPRAQNSSSPHLELDLSLPLDLHGIGLGFEVEEDKPKRRGKNGGDKQNRPRLPQKSRARRQSVDSISSMTSQENDIQQIKSKQHEYPPKTPPSSGKLLASAMERDSAMGLGLDFGFEGLNQEVERMRGIGKRFSTSNSSSPSSSSIAAMDALGLTFEEHTLLSNAGKRSSHQRVNMIRRESTAPFSQIQKRPGTADSVCSTSTVRATPNLDDPSHVRHVYGDVGFAL